MRAVSDKDVEAKFRVVPTHPTVSMKYHRVIDEALFDSSLPDTPAKGAQIADKLAQLFVSLSTAKEFDSAFQQMMLIIVSCTKIFPPDHHFQDVLLEALERLRQHPGPHPEYLFVNLPWLGIFVTDFWNDSTIREIPTDDEYDEEDVLRWKCMNSFWARFMKESYIWDQRPLGECRRAFEEPDEKGPPMETRLWGATEWIIRCAGLWTRELAAISELDDFSRGWYGVGSLVKGTGGVHIFSRERWAFWRKRLLEIKANWASYELDEVTPERVDKAVQVLDELLPTVEWKMPA